MPRRPRTPQRLRELGAAAGEKVAAATRTAAKTGRVLVSKVRNYNRPTIECTETDADGRKCTRAFTVHKQIGEGAYSTVYKVCEWQPDGRAHIYAMKRVVAQDDESRRRARGEVELMRRLPPHPNILNLIAFHAIETEQGMTMHLLLEMCAHGSLAHYLIAKEGEPLGRPQVYRLFLDMAHALQHLHAQHPPVAHRDFKLENCLLATDGFAKLCDFGSATCRAKSYVGKREVDNAEDEFHRMCTAQYRSPEMFDVHRGHLVNEKVDVWALGIAFFKLLCNKEAFAPGEEKLGALNESWRLRIPLPQPGRSALQQRMNSAPDPVGRQLLEMLLQQQPLSRPSISEVLQWLRAQTLPVGCPAASPVANAYRPGKLTVHVRAAEGLLCKGVSAQPVTYARVTCEGAARQTSDAGGAAPRWSARFAFVSHSLARVHVAVWQRQPGGVADEFLGQLALSVHAEQARRAGEGGSGGGEGEGGRWHNLERRSERSRVAGRVLLELQLLPLPAHRDDWADWSNEIDGVRGVAPSGPRSAPRTSAGEVGGAGEAGDTPAVGAQRPSDGAFASAVWDSRAAAFVSVHVGSSSANGSSKPGGGGGGGGGGGSGGGGGGSFWVDAGAAPSPPSPAASNGGAPAGAREPPRGRRPLVADHSVTTTAAATAANGHADASWLRAEQPVRERSPSPELMGQGKFGGLVQADFDPFGLEATERAPHDLIAWDAVAVPPTHDSSAGTSGARGRGYGSAWGGEPAAVSDWGLVADPFAPAPALPPSLHAEPAPDLLGSPLRGGAGAGGQWPGQSLGTSAGQPARSAEPPTRSVQDAMRDAFAPVLLPTQAAQPKPLQPPPPPQPAGFRGPGGTPGGGVGWQPRTMQPMQPRGGLAPALQPARPPQPAAKGPGKFWD